MPKVRTTLTIDRDIMRAVRFRAAASGRSESEVVEEALRRDLGLNVLEEIWADAEQMDEAAAMALAVEAQARTRGPRR